MLHSLFMHYKSEFEDLKVTARCENFDTLKPLLQKRTWAIEIESKEELQSAYTELFKEIKKLNVSAAKHYQQYIKNRLALIKKIDIERATVASESLLADYVADLGKLKEEILKFDAEIDLNFLKKLEETLRQEKAGFSQQSLFAFFQHHSHEQEHRAYSVAEVKQ